VRLIDRLKCKLGFHDYRNLLFLTLCIRCHKADPSHDHKPATDFLVQRYTNPTETNRPGKDFSIQVNAEGKHDA
jgi:hypothetical protein